jgi:hypothetical protein
MVDVRKELSLINKHVRQHHRDSSGESVIWYEFEPLGGSASAGSLYDDVYDEGVLGEGGRRYRPGVPIRTIYVEEIEDRFTLQEDGRQPTQNIYVVMLFDDVRRAGLSNPREYKPHLNDLFNYDGRFYKVTEYVVRGRLEDEVILKVQGFEVYIDQEFNLDVPPDQPTVQDLPWPSTLPFVVV